MHNKKERIGWYFYDWANSAFYTTVITVFLGPYLTTIAKNASDLHGFIYPFGIQIQAGSLFPYTVSFSVLLQILFLPLLGAVADSSNLKKQFFAFFAYCGAIFTMFLYFLEGTKYLMGSAFFIFANVSFGASVVFYNAFLPDIASAEERDAVSSKGWALGYVGGGILLGLNLLLFIHSDFFGLSKEHAIRISLASAGAWWALFTVIPLMLLKNRRPHSSPSQKNYFFTGWKQLLGTFTNAKNYPLTFSFLLAFLLYNDGIQSVIILSSQFGQEELGLSIITLIQVVLLVQGIASIGALVFNRIAQTIQAKNTIIITLCLWILALIYTYGFLKTKFQFYILSVVIALILGGSQALSRSLFSRMIPPGKESEYFGLYEISERGSSWFGPLFFGLMLQFTGSYRIGILSLILFFIGGLALLYTINVQKAITDAHKLF